MFECVLGALFFSLAYMEQQTRCHMRPSLWGPSVWKIMLACTWRLPDDENTLALVQRFLLVLVPDILPCSTCAQHYRNNLAVVHRKAKGRPGTGDHAFRWCWYMKHEVNTHLGTTSIHLADLVERYLLHGPVLPEVEVADVLVLVAIQARADAKDDIFVEFCSAMHAMLPARDDSSVFMHYLKHIARPILPTTLRLARSTRHAHGLPHMDLRKYKATVR